MVVQFGVFGNAGVGIPNPIGREVFGHSFLNAQHLICNQFELNWHKCMEAFGHYLGTRYCDLEWRDFNECVYNTKKLKRKEAMRNERLKQFLNGERDRPFLERWPKPNQCRPDHYDRYRIF